MNKMTPSKEDYLKAIWTIAERDTERETAGTNDLAEHLRVSAPAVTKMLKQMEEKSLVARIPYYGVKLTDDGRKVAVKIVRRHRLLELFLFQILKYPSDTVHDEAERLEHHISQEFEDRIDSLMDFPRKCPHGSPIPTRSGEIIL